MTIEPQRFLTPEGTEMIVIPASEYERLLAAQAERPLEDATGTLMRIRDEGTIPAQVLDAIVDKGLTPLAAWRHYRGLTQAELARRAGLHQTAIGLIERRERAGLRITIRRLAEALDAPRWSLEEL